MTKSSTPKPLPDNPIHLDLDMLFPLSSLTELRQDYESQGQDDKWSVYFRDPWIQIWRPNRRGRYCYAVRLEEYRGLWLRVAESWVGSQILDAKQGLGPDLRVHRQVVGEHVLSRITEPYTGEKFEDTHVSGKRGRSEVTFAGSVSTVEDVDAVATRLRGEICRLTDWP